MKRTFYISLATLLTAMLIGCAGQTEESSSSLQMNSLLLGGHFQSIQYKVYGNNTVNGITGQWISENRQGYSYSVITLDEAGFFKEDIHSNLNRDFLESFPGQYTITDSRLTIQLDSGEIFRLNFDLTGNHLTFSPLSSEDVKHALRD